MRTVFRRALAWVLRWKVDSALTSEESVQAVLDWVREGEPAAKAHDWRGRFREIVSDPINLLIERHPMAGCTKNGFVVLHNGNVVPVEGPNAYYEEFSDILVINRGVHEPLEEFIFQELIKKLPENPTMIELGAYWAHYSMWLKAKRPMASAYLVEPDPHNLAVGRNNVRVNGQHAEFIQAAVGQEFEVDNFASAEMLGKIDILHMDVQGFELEALAGASKCLAAKMIDYIFVSTHDDDLHQKVCAVLAHHSYRIELSEDVGVETTSGDGLVFASSTSVEPVVSGLRPFGRLAITRARPQAIIQTIAEICQTRMSATHDI
jgi:hypothetical protein